MMESLIGLVGVMLGFILSEGATWWRERRTTKEQVQSVRTMLSVEIDDNLAMLSAFWVETLSDDYTFPAPDNLKRELSDNLVLKPLSIWSHNLWESQLSLVPIVLNSSSIGAIHKHHNKLKRLSEVHLSMVILKRNHPNARSVVDVINAYSNYPTLVSQYTTSQYESDAPALWTEFKKLTNEILDEGNPLKEIG